MGSAVVAAEPGTNGALDRLVSYFSTDLKNLNEEMDQINARLTVISTFDQQTAHFGYSSKEGNDNNFQHFIQLDLGQPYAVDKIVLVPIYNKFMGWPGPGYGFPVRYKVTFSNTLEPIESDVVATVIEDQENPGMEAVVIPVNHNQIGRYVRITATWPWKRKLKRGVNLGLEVFALGEVLVLSGNRNLAAGLKDSAFLFLPNDSLDGPYKASYLVDGQSVLGPPVTGEPGTKGFMTKPVDNGKTTEWVQVDLEQEISVEEVRLLPAWNPDVPERRGIGFPTNFRIEVSNDPNMDKDHTVQLTPYADNSSPNENPVTIRGYGAKGRYVRLTATTLTSIAKNQYALAIGEMEIYNETENFALRKRTTSSSSFESKGWSAKYLTDSTTSQGKLIPWQDWFDLSEKRKDDRDRLEQLRKERETKSKRAVETVIRAAGYVIGASTLLFVYLSFRSLLKKRRAVEELRARIARDIHDEIGSGMGTISLLSRMAQDGDWDDAKEDLREINRLSMSMAESVRDIVWFNRTDVDTVRDLLMKMRETAETMLGKQMEINFQTLGTELVRPINMEIRREIFLIYKEALHNILKHAEAKQVEISTGLDGGEFVLNLRDDGKGFDLTEDRAGAGMGSMKKRAESLRGSLQLETAPGGGTALALRAKLK
jgi:signal transduction histidine kinase